MPRFTSRWPYIFLGCVISSSGPDLKTLPDGEAKTESEYGLDSGGKHQGNRTYLKL
jgi:hypothetical protein